LYTEFKNSNQATITGTEEGAKMFQGASFHTENTKFKRVPFNQFHKKSFSEISKSGGWFAVSQRYFASAISLNYAGKFYTKFVPYHSTCLIGHLSDKIKLDTNQSITFNQKVYSGPAKKELLKKFASSFEFVIDYGFFWPVCAIILSILEFIHLVIYNWGLAIVFATISIRLLLLGLTTKSIKITKKMQELQPKLEAIKKLYPDDQVLLSQEMMAMYKKEGINPIIGFLVPIITALIQIPIFIAFYSVLMETVSLRQAPFISWITDLSLKDSFYVIPVFVTATSYFQQTLTPKPQDETMAMMFKIMPFFLGAICINLPAGLGLYWITNNLISIIQAWSTKYGSLADRT
jgi:YidC/Oxa1 family membrane protein insertase